MELPFFTVYN